MRQLSRRSLLLTAGPALLFPVPAAAQQSSAVKSLGFLASNSPSGHKEALAAFRQALQAQGYVEGRNLRIDYRWAAGNYKALPRLAADLVKKRVDVIVTMGGPPAAFAAKAATRTIPIVFQVGGANPVATGLIASFSRPGGNITGTYSVMSALDRKRLEVLHEAVPGAALIAVLYNPSFPSSAANLNDIEAAAAALKVRLFPAPARGAAGIDEAFASMHRAGVGAMLDLPDPFLFSRYRRMVALAARYKIPAIYEWREIAEGGGLMAYGDSIRRLYRIAGDYAGRILNGTRPADLPIDQPAVIELVVNLKTAKALGLALPRLILARVDALIH